MAVNKDKKRHRDRKNPHAHDLYKQANHDQNAKRGKQVWIPPTPANPFDQNSTGSVGGWIRE